MWRRFHHATALARPSGVARSPLHAVTLHDMENTCFDAGIFADGTGSNAHAHTTAASAQTADINFLLYLNTFIPYFSLRF